MTPNDVLKFAEENECQMVDFKFLDFIGIWQHFSAPIDQFIAAIPVLSLKKRKLILNLPELPIRLILAQKLSFLFLMMSVMLQLLTNHSIQLIRLREPGTPGGRNSRILVTSRATKKVTSLAPQLILTLISATKSYKCYKVSALLLRWSIMKFQPVVKMKLASDLILS